MYNEEPILVILVIPQGRVSSFLLWYEICI